MPFFHFNQFVQRIIEINSISLTVSYPWQTIKSLISDCIFKGYSLLLKIIDAVNGKNLLFRYLKILACAGTKKK